MKKIPFYTSQYLLLSLVIRTALSEKSPPCLTENLRAYFFKAKNLISLKLQSSFNLRVPYPVTAVKHSCQNCLPKRAQLRTQSLAKNVCNKTVGGKKVQLQHLCLSCAPPPDSFFFLPQLCNPQTLMVLENLQHLNPTCQETEGALCFYLLSAAPDIWRPSIGKSLRLHARSFMCV